MNFMEMLVEYGMAGIFIAYMIWQDSSNSKKADQQLIKFENQLDRMREKHSADQKELRSRYDEVIQKYDNERQGFQKQKSDLKLKVITLMGECTNRLDNFNQKINDSDSKIDECLSLLKDIISDQKIRDIKNQEQNRLASIIQSKD